MPDKDEKTPANIFDLNLLIKAIIPTFSPDISGANSPDDPSNEKTVLQNARVPRPASNYPSRPVNKIQVVKREDWMSDNHNQRKYGKGVTIKKLAIFGSDHGN